MVRRPAESLIELWASARSNEQLRMCYFGVSKLRAHFGLVFRRLAMVHSRVSVFICQVDREMPVPAWMCMGISGVVARMPFSLRLQGNLWFRAGPSCPRPTSAPLRLRFTISYQ